MSSYVPQLKGHFHFSSESCLMSPTCKSCPLWLFIPSLRVVFLVRWQYLGRAPALSRWVFTWWSRAASLCLNRLSCRVCPSPSLWRPGEAQTHSGYHCVTHLCLTEDAKYYGIKELSEVYFWEEGRRSLERLLYLNQAHRFQAEL